MLFSVATGVGLQKRIKEKISGFNGHIQIVNYDSNNSRVTVTPVSRNQDFYPDFKSVPNVKKVQVYVKEKNVKDVSRDLWHLIKKRLKKVN